MLLSIIYVYINKLKDIFIIHLYKNMNRGDFIVDCIENKKPIKYCKFGDGEYFCMNKYSNNIDMNQNCDKDIYTRKLSDSLVESFKYLSTLDDVLIGQWHHGHVSTYLSTHTTNNIKRTSYQTFIFDDSDYQDDNNFTKKINIYKAIKNSNLKKIYVCNKLLVKSKILLNIDHLVHVPFNNWFDNQFESILNQVKSLMGNEQCIVMTSCGMSAKVLIAELNKFNPNCIYLDLGSSIDLICTKRDSRGYVNYETIYNKFQKHFQLPENWNDPIYEPIYQESKANLGLHL